MTCGTGLRLVPLIVLANLVAMSGAISPGQTEGSAVFSIGKYRKMHEEDRASL